MRIYSSDITLASSSLDVKYSSKFEYLRKWDRQSELVTNSFEENGEIVKQSHIQRDRVELSAQMIKDQKKKFSPSLEDDSGKEPVKDSIEGVWSDLRMKIVKDLVELFTGRKIEVLDADKLRNLENNTELSEEPKDTKKNSTPVPLTLPSRKIESQAIPVSSLQSGKLEGWGVDYYYKETQYQKEGFNFSASGKITNDKGQEIGFDTSLQMSREKYDEITISLKEGDALIDPLVIDFSGTGASLADMKFEFDLDADGKTEMIHAPSAGTAFLAYDKNGNGVIDDGSELFGPSSGNGFSELADLDDDKNGWIDENDSAFSKLRLWEKSADGTDTISSLLERDVGALYTGRAETNFNMVNNESVSGVVKESGIFLKESGGTGFLQEIDIVV